MASQAVRSASPATIFGWGSLEQLADVIGQHRPSRVLVVAGSNSYAASGAADVIEPILRPYRVTTFARSDALPTLGEVESGRRVVRDVAPDMIIAVGGGGVLDLAKAIRTPFSVIDEGPARRVHIDDTGEPHIPLVAIPTTAGTGAETTQFAVLYIEGVKHSIDDPGVLPEHAIVDPSLTQSAAPKLTAVTGMDALAQGIESIWSVASTDRSARFASRAVALALQNLETAVLAPTRRAREAMAMAAHLSGRAINHTRTTACHAVSYPITARHGIPHGHAVALTLPQMLVFNAHVTNRDVNDAGGVQGVRRKVGLVLKLLGVDTPEAGSRRLQQLMRRISLETTLSELGISDVDGIVAEGFDPARAGNNPRHLTPQQLSGMLT